MEIKKKSEQEAFSKLLRNPAKSYLLQSQRVSKWIFEGTG